MDKMVRVGWLVFAIFAFLTFEGSAGEPGNGFLSGPHYNLNIIGKKAGFSCPAEVDPLTGLYGNVIFAPEYLDPDDPNGYYKILMKSGRKAAYTDLNVVDNCAFLEGVETVGQAVIELPKSDLGYYVFGRVLAKPGKDPEQHTITIYNPTLASVRDESGNDLVYLGLVTTSGFESTTQPFTRFPGKSKAGDITGLFMWKGEICYLTSPDPSILPTSKTLCAQDLDGNLVADDADLNGIPDVLQPLPDTGLCPVGFVPVTLNLFCVSYADADAAAQWVFNIGDLVDYFWQVTDQGVKLLQVRFYPVTQ